jgi:hypothetical protein
MLNLPSPLLRLEKRLKFSNIKKMKKRKIWQYEKDEKRKNDEKISKFSNIRVTRLGEFSGR